VTQPFRSRPSGEDGFTLVELMIGMVIVGIIIASIGAALTVGFRTTDSTTERLNESHDAQISSAYLANDVQSASTVSIGGGGSCASATTIASFTYADGRVATYGCGPYAGETRVTRTFDGGSVVLAHFAGPATPNVTCSPSCTATPDRVEIAFTEASGYAYTLIGSRRLATGTFSSGTSPEVTLLVLGGSSPLWVSGGCPPGQINNPGLPEDEQCTEDTEPGQLTRPKLTVVGNLYVNSTLTKAVWLTGLRNQLKLEVLSGNFGILAGGGCVGCTPNTVNVMPGSYSPAYLDPLRFMQPPPQSGPNIYVHGSQLSITGSTSLPAGIHILKAGMNIAGNANLSVSGSGGIMFYNEAGSISFAGGSRVNLPAYASAPYKNILIFQARGNTNALSLSGGTNVASCLGGIVYAPDSSAVTLGTGGANLRVTAVVSQQIKVIGDSGVTIGGSC
jgi:prepilin-type N-terminal cleavage/methylation domain-containing protein